MSDKNNNLETTRQDEWSGTPFQGWKESDGGENEAQGVEQQMESVEERTNAVEASAGLEEAPAQPDAEAAEVETPAAETQEPQAIEQPVAAVVGRAGTASEGTGHAVDYNRTFRSLTEGDVVQGVVVHIDKEGVLVDVGTKSEGIIRPNELSRQSNLSPEDVVSVGESIDVYVIQSEDQDGGLVLSKKRADFERAWERVEEALQSGKMLSAMVTDRVKGGLVVDLGIRGFVPASHVGSGKIKNLDKFVGQSIPLKVIEVDRERRKVVLSNRQAADEEREKQRIHTLESLAEGQVRGGIVRRLTDYGAFVDLGGIDGLLHVSEMSWTRIKHPSDVVKVGDKIQVMILKLDLANGKVSLGLRQILPDPWAELENKYRVGDTITAKVSRLVPFGAFIQLPEGIEGIIPNSELAQRRVNKPEDVVQVGQEVEVKIIDLRPEERRMTMSLRQLQQQVERERERSEMSSYGNYSSREEPRTTIGDLVGDMIKEARSAKRERKRKLREAEEIGDEELMDVEELVAEEVETPESEREVEAVAETTPEVEVVEQVEEAEPEAVVAEPEAEVAQEPEVEAVAEPVAEPEVEAVAEPEVEAAVEPEPEPEPVAEAVEVTESPAEEADVEETPVAQAEEPAVEAEAEPQPEAQEETPEEKPAE